MRRDVGVDVIVRLADKLAAPLRDLEGRVVAAGRKMTDSLKVSARLDTSRVDRLADRLSATGRQAQQFGRDQMQLTREQLGASRQRTMSLYGEAMGVAAQGWAYTQALRPAIAFEAKMAEVAKVVDFEGATGISDLGNDVQALVTSGGLPMAADGIADIIAAAAQAGVVDAALPDAEKRRQLVAFAEAAGKMGVAFDISAADAGSAMAEWQARLKLTQHETLLLGDAVNHLSNNMNASAADITDIIGRVGGFAQVAGLNSAEIAALATAFRTAAPSAEIAATSMKNFTSALVMGEAMTKQQSAVMERLGFDSVELAKRMGVDARGAIFDVMEALKQLPEHEQAAALSLLFGQESVSAVAPLLGNLDQLRQAFDLVGDEASYAGAMQAEYEGVAGTTAAKLVVFRNYLTQISVSLMPLLSVITDVTAALQPMLQGVADWMRANPEIVKGIGIAVAGLFGLRIGLLGIRMMVEPLISLFWVFNGALIVAVRGYGFALRGVAALVRVFGVLRAALPLVARGIVMIGRALLANPIGLAVAAIAGAAYLIYANWEDVGPWFARFWGNIRDIFGGFVQFVAGIFTGDIGGAVAGLQRIWDGLKGYYQTLWDGIAGVFRWAWESVIRPITDALGATETIIAGWDAAKTAIGAVLDWLSDKFTAIWAVIAPVIDGLKWVKDKGAEALASVGLGSGGQALGDAEIAAVSANTSLHLPPRAPAVATPHQGAIDALFGNPTPRAQGGSFGPGLLLVGERGPELRYESRGGFIAHHNALRGLVDMSQRARARADLVMGEGAGPDMAGQMAPIMAPVPASAGRPISHQPHYNIVINGSGLDAAQLRAAVRAELQAASRRAAADLRGLLHD